MEILLSILWFIAICIVGFCAGWGLADILQCIFTNHPI